MVPDLLFSPALELREMLGAADGFAVWLPVPDFCEFAATGCRSPLLALALTPWPGSMRQSHVAQ